MLARVLLALQRGIRGLLEREALIDGDAAAQRQSLLNLRVNDADIIRLECVALNMQVIVAYWSAEIERRYCFVTGK